MTNQKRTQFRVLSLVSLSLIIAAATYGFAAASSDHDAGLLGAGYGVKSAYEVSKVNYTLDLGDPTKFTAVDFVLDQDGGDLSAGVSTTEKGQVTWADNCEKSDTRWTCTFEDSVDVLAANWLHVQ
ncbi:MAG: hypothetical protein WBB69_17365 [Anaerolineales bacterium]